VLVADVDEGLDLLRLADEGDRCRQGLTAAVVVALGPAVARVGQQRIRSDGGAQCAKGAIR
jgi:hypothetical protein